MDHREKKALDGIKYLLKNGELGYEEAKDLSEKPLKDMNVKMAKIAKEFGKKHVPVTFTKIMR